MKRRPPLYTFDSQCKDKRRYTAREAQRRAEERGLRVYKCQWCGGRHLTGRLTA